MENLESEYPTEQQIEEMWTALETGDDHAVLSVLRKRKQERANAESQKKESDSLQCRGVNQSGRNSD